MARDEQSWTLLNKKKYIIKFAIQLKALFTCGGKAWKMAASTIPYV